MNFGPSELVILLMGLVPLAVTVWAVVDAATRPDWAFVQSGQNKVLWIVLPIAASFFFCSGWLVAIIYLAAIRPKVVAAQSSGPGAPPGYGPPGYGQGFGGPPGPPPPGYGAPGYGPPGHGGPTGPAGTPEDRPPSAY
jgi:hypothetical protein